MPVTLPDGDDLSAATFEQILFAVTGTGPDLRGQLDTGGAPGGEHTWLLFSDEPGEQNSWHYRAWKVYYFGVDRNTAAFSNWRTMVEEINGVAQQLSDGKLGLMDTQRLWDSAAVVDQYLSWLNTSLQSVQTWTTSLSGEGSAFKGKAAYAIKANLERLAFTMNDLYMQIIAGRRPATPDGLRGAAQWLGMFGRGMANAWWESNAFLLNAAANAANVIVANVRNYLSKSGLFVVNKGTGGDPYYLDGENPLGLSPEEWIVRVLSTYDSHSYAFIGDVEFHDGMAGVSGDLRARSTWDAFNAAISGYVRAELVKLDGVAQPLITVLGRAYEDGSRSLAELKTNQPPALGSPLPKPGGPGGGEMPPPPDIDFDPDGGKDDDKKPGPDDGKFVMKPPPGPAESAGGAGGGPNGSGGGPGGAGGGPDGSDGAGGREGVDRLLRKLAQRPDALGGMGGGAGDGIGGPEGLGNRLPPMPDRAELPGGRTDPAGGAGMVPPPVPPAGPGPAGPPGQRRPRDRDTGQIVPPPADGRGPDDADGWSPPQPGAVPPPSPGSSDLPELHPSGRGAPDGALGMGPGAAPGSGPGFDPGAPEGGAGAGAGLGAGAGAGLGAGGQGTDGLRDWSDWSERVPGAGSPGQAAAGGPAAESRADQPGGMPFFPPMMGGMGGPGGGGGGDRERERQTWLTEDEKVWGADRDPCPGVIGRPGGDEPGADEPLAPTHVHVRSVAPRGKTTGAPARRGAESTESG